MKLEEVCKAFGEEKKLTNKEGYVYEIDKIGNNIKVTKPLAKTRGVSITPFVDPESMSINDNWSKPEYVVHDGIPCYFGNGKIASFTKSDLQVKWKVVRRVEE